MNTSSENTAVETNVAATTAAPETNAAHTEPVSGEAVHETSTFAPPTIYSETIGHIVYSLLTKNTNNGANRKN
jgi:hypothetical protein